MIPGAPHGMRSTLKDQVNAELLAFFKGVGGSGLVSSQPESRAPESHSIRPAARKPRSNRKGRKSMKIVVIGGSGLIGSKVTPKLGAGGHQAVAASPESGVNTLTGKGLAEVLKGAQVVVDVSNSPSFEDKAVMEFFKTSTGNLLKHEAAAGVRHHVALSVVGTERLLESGYMRAKLAQEKLIKESSIPYSIVRATQFLEFGKSIADDATDGNTVRLPPVLFQPIAADDVASAVAGAAAGSPLNGTIEIGGPEQFRFDDFIRRVLSARHDPREVIADPHARYFGAELSERTLIPADGAQLGEARFADWLKKSAAAVRRKEPETMADNELRISEVPTGLVVAGGRLDKRVMTNATDFVTSHGAGEWGMGTYTGGRRAPTHDEIARLAFNLYESRGRQDGHDVEDWLRAEEELVQRYA